MTQSANNKIEINVAYLGPAGTYSQLAAMEFFGSDVGLVDCSTIDDVFSAVETAQTTHGIVPVENSTEGAINNTQDCLVDCSAKIIGEQIVSIEHSLLAQSGTKKSDIRRIASHKQSLAQCRNYLSANFPQVEQLECSSNAEAAILAQSDANTAAIASGFAATIYKLHCLEDHIQDKSNNRTRFLVLSLGETEATGEDKTSILVYTENKPGALFRVLEPFEKYQLSLTKIETRPSKKEAWEYVFFIDFEGHAKDRITMELFDVLKVCGAEVKLLGSYPASKLV